MRVSVRPVLKAVFSRAVSALTRHHVALLAPEAADEQLIFRLRAPYRLRDRVLTIELLEPGNGRLTAILVGYDGHFPRVPLWQSEPANHAGPVSFVFDPDSGDVRLGAQTWGRSVAPEGRRFCWRFELVTERGTVRRLTGHYRPADGRLVDQSYYYGDDYVDYAEQSQGDHAMVLGLAARVFGGRSAARDWLCHRPTAGHPRARGLRRLGCRFLRVGGRASRARPRPGSRLPVRRGIGSASRRDCLAHAARGQPQPPDLCR